MFIITCGIRQHLDALLISGFILQVRGSIPLYWNQEGVTHLKPDITLQHYDPLYTATRLHFEVSSGSNWLLHYLQLSVHPCADSDKILTNILTSSGSFGEQYMSVALMLLHYCVMSVYKVMQT